MSLLPDGPAGYFRFPTRDRLLLAVALALALWTAPACGDPAGVPSASPMPSAPSGGPPPVGHVSETTPAIPASNPTTGPAAGNRDSAVSPTRSTLAIPPADAAPAAATEPGRASVDTSVIKSTTNLSRAAPPSTTVRGYTYSLADFLDIVMARSPGVESAILRAKAAAYQASAIRASYFPKLSAVGQVGGVKGSGISPLEDLGNIQRNHVSGFIDGGGGSFNIPLYTDGTLLGINTPPKAAVYNAIRSQAQAQVLLARDQLRVQAIEAYYLAFEDAKKSKLVDREVSMLNQLANIAQIQYNHQIISKEEFQNSKIRVELAAQDLEESEWDKANAFVVVASLLGIDDATMVHLPAEQPLPKTLPSFQAVLSQVLQSSPTLTQQVAVLDQAKAQRALTVTQFEPSATIDNSYQYGDDFSGSGRYQILSLLRISVPIFDGGENYYELRSATKTMEAEKAGLYQTKLNLESDLHQAYESVENLRRVYLQNELIAGQKEILVEEDQQLSASGAVSLPDFVDAQLGYVNASLTAEESYYTMMASYADLDKASAYIGMVPLLGSHVQR